MSASGVLAENLCHGRLSEIYLLEVQPNISRVINHTSPNRCTRETVPFYVLTQFVPKLNCLIDFVILLPTSYAPLYQQTMFFLAFPILLCFVHIRYIFTGICVNAQPSKLNVGFLAKMSHKNLLFEGVLAVLHLLTCLYVASQFDNIFLQQKLVKTLNFKFRCESLNTLFNRTRERLTN